MSHSGETLHYRLPKYVGTDIINPLTDFNDANDAIDEALYNANSSAASAVETAEGAASTVGSYNERITQAQQAADNALIQSDNTMDMMAEEFDPLKQGGYAIGDIVIYQQKLYTFINPHTGAWDAGDVVQQPIGDAVKATIEQGKSDIAEETAEALAEIAGQTQKVTATQAMITEPFDANKAGGYAIGASVTYADKLYKFTSPHVGAWTGLDVVEYDLVTSFQDGVDTIYDAIVAEGVTPASSTPSACAAGIHSLANQTWTAPIVLEARAEGSTNGSYIHSRAVITAKNMVGLVADSLVDSGSVGQTSQSIYYKFTDVDGAILDSGYVYKIDPLHPSAPSQFPYTFTLPTGIDKAEFDITLVTTASGKLTGNLTATYTTKKPN